MNRLIFISPDRAWGLQPILSSKKWFDALLMQVRGGVLCPT
jgi:hypothetical protein